MVSAAARKIRIVTECSGLEPLPYVFERLGLAGRYEMAAACEIDPICSRAFGHPKNPQTMIFMLLVFLANRSQRWELDKECVMAEAAG